MNLLLRIISTAGHATAPFLNCEIVGAIGVAGTMAHFVLTRALRHTKTRHQEMAIEENL